MQQIYRTPMPKFDFNKVVKAATLQTEKKYVTPFYTP